MKITMSATEARVHFGQLLKHVQNGDEVLVEKRGVPVALFIKPVKYRTLLLRMPPDKLTEGERVWLEKYRNYDFDMRAKKRAAAKARATTTITPGANEGDAS